MMSQSELNVFLIGILETVAIDNLVLEYVNQRLDPSLPMTPHCPQSKTQEQRFDPKVTPKETP
jgi:hypothetical protein